MLRIRFTNSAEADLLELWLSIAEENLVAADESLDSILEMGKARPEFADGLRSFPTRTSYIIFYMLDKNGLLNVRMLHHARDIDADCFS